MNRKGFKGNYETLKGKRHDTCCYNCFCCLIPPGESSRFYCCHEKYSEVLCRDLTKKDLINIWDLTSNQGVLVPWCFEYEPMGKPTKNIIEELENNFSGVDHGH